MHIRSKIQHYLLTPLILISLLVACQGGEGEKPTSPSVTITFACREWQESTYRDLADQFEAANPDIRVQLNLVGRASNPRDAVTRADTLVMSVYPALTQQGLVRDLTPFIEADRAFQPEDFYPHTLESLQWDGGTWGLPFAVNFHLIFYDKESFDAAGVPYPEPGWTWDDFLSKAQTLTEREGEEVVRWGFVRWQRDPTPFIRGRAGPLMDTSVEPPELLLDRPEVVKAVRWFTDLVLVHRVMPHLSPEQSQPVDSEAAWLVEGGQAAMWNESTDSWELRSHGRALGMVPFPVGGPTSATTPIELRSYAMSAGTIHPQESWRWLAFLSRQAIHREGLPARRSVAEESGYWDSLDPEVAAVYRFALEHSFSSVKAAWGWSALGEAWGWSVLDEAIEAVLQQEQTVEEALVEAQLAAYAHVERESPESAAPTPFAVATPQPTADAEGVTIVFVVQNWWELQAAYKALAAKFHELHPGIEVKVKGPDWEADVQSVELPWLAAQADCFDYYLLPLSDDTDVILNLDPLIEADPSFSLDDYYPQSLEAPRHEGRLWALPAEGYPTVMYYNKALFDASGLAYPSSDWTVDDFRALATALTENEEANRRYGYVPYKLYSDALFFVGQQGVQLAVDDTDPSACALDAPEVVEAVRWYTGLVLSGAVPKLDPEEYNFRRWQTLVGAEQVAMWSVSPGHGHSVFDTWKDLEVGFVPMPQGPGRIGDFDWSGYYISEHTEHPQACWGWLKFLSEQVSIVQGVPARRSVAESDAYRHQMGVEVADVYRDTLERSQQLLTYAMYDNKRTRYLRGAVWDILNGEGVEQALNAARLDCESSLQ
jgi:multiple sugar transport system substrate-binding protein